MAFYRAVFVKADVKSEVELKPTYTLVGKSREDAESEALRLPRPRGANFVKLLREGLYEAPRVVFAL